MKDLFEPAVLHELEQRLEKLRPDSPRQWGKMEPAQMLAHCAIVMEIATGDQNLPRLFIGRLIGRFIKGQITNHKPFKPGLPTARNFVMADAKDFAREKDRVLHLLRRFATGGPERASKHPHPLFGKMTPEEWSVSTYKHLDHHLRQFGV